MIARIHSYAGLLTLINLMLYGVVGIAALFDGRGIAPPVIREQPFDRDARSDREVAERVVRLLDLSLATPVHDFAIGHDAAGHLALDFYHANGRDQVTVLENPGRLRIAHKRASLLQYLATLHVTTAVFHSGDWRMQLWAWWNEFAMWSMGLMAASGLWIWRERRGAGGTARRIHRSTALGALTLILVYEISAVQMAHRTWVKVGTVWAALQRIHRMRGAGLAPIVGIAILVLAATGLWLSWTPPRDRPAGAALLGIGLLIGGGLIYWMRLG